MATWSGFAAAAPDMAGRGFRQLSIPLAYLATVRKNGAPRLHPVSPLFAGDRLFIAVEHTSPKRFDLLRDGRYSMHALPPAPPPVNPDYDEFEFNITGRALLVKDAATRSNGSESRPVQDPRERLRIRTGYRNRLDHGLGKARRSQPAADPEVMERNPAALM